MTLILNLLGYAEVVFGRVIIGFGNGVCGEETLL
jgi:hypothetical protein